MTDKHLDFNQNYYTGWRESFLRAFQTWNERARHFGMHLALPNAAANDPLPPYDAGLRHWLEMPPEFAKLMRAPYEAMVTSGYNDPEYVARNCQLIDNFFINVRRSMLDSLSPHVRSLYLLREAGVAVPARNNPPSAEAAARRAILRRRSISTQQINELMIEARGDRSRCTAIRALIEDEIERLSTLVIDKQAEREAVGMEIEKILEEERRALGGDADAAAASFQTLGAISILQRRHIGIPAAISTLQRRIDDLQERVGELDDLERGEKE